MNGAQKEKIKVIAERVLKNFGISYLRAYKVIMIREAKAKRKGATKKEEEEDSSWEERQKRTPNPFAKD
jgi:hypothetical protein